MQTCTGGNFEIEANDSTLPFQDSPSFHVRVFDASGGLVTSTGVRTSSRRDRRKAYTR